MMPRNKASTYQCNKATTQQGTNCAVFHFQIGRQSKND